MRAFANHFSWSLNWSCLCVNRFVLLEHRVLNDSWFDLFPEWFNNVFPLKSDAYQSKKNIDQPVNYINYNSSGRKTNSAPGPAFSDCLNDDCAQIIKAQDFVVECFFSTTAWWQQDKTELYLSWEKVLMLPPMFTTDTNTVSQIQNSVRPIAKKSIQVKGLRFQLYLYITRNFIDS